MKKQDAISLAVMEFLGRNAIYGERKYLTAFGRRVLELYATPYSDKIKPLGNGKKK
ncbi:MAG: hypothetical protein AABY22_13825 [Nanoarchaeota archaeon]